MATTLFWNVFSGKWDDPASWLGNVAPKAGDTGVVAHGPLTNATVDLSGLTIAGQTIQVVAANQLSFGGTTLAADTTLATQDVDGLVMSFTGPNTLKGTVELAAPTDLYLIPGTTSLVANEGAMTISAATKVLGFGTVVNSGTIAIGNSKAASSFTVVGASGGVQNDGLISVTGGAGLAVGDTTATFAGVSGTGMITAAHAEVTFNGAVTGGMFQFADTSAVLQLNIDTAGFDAIITKFDVGNRIDLGTTEVDSVAYIADPGGFTGTLNISNNGALVAALKMDGNFTTGSFVLSDTGGDFSLTVPCFAEGTRLATVRGEVAVEDIRVGDVLPTLLGGAEARVVWTGWRAVECRRHPRPHDVLPVRVRAGAFAAGVPARDVVLSPDHAVFQEGVLIPVRYLLNDATIVQEAVGAITYWHVELERHSVVCAAGLPVESYLETGNRGDFANGPQPRSLHPDFSPVDPMAVWAERACAPLRLEGAEAAAARAGLLARAEAMGWRLLPGGGPRVVVDGQEVAAVVDGAAWLVPLPRGARRLRLESAAGVPALMRAGGGDGRRLGVAVAGLLWDGVPAGLDDARLGAGWHAAEAGWRWTDGGGEIDVAGLADIGFTVMAAEWSWTAPEEKEAFFFEKKNQKTFIPFRVANG